MVLIEDGYVEHVAHVWRVTFIEKESKSSTAVDLNKCLEQIELPILLLSHLFPTHHLRWKLNEEI